MDNVQMYKNLKKFYNHIGEMINYRAKYIDLKAFDIDTINFLLKVMKYEMPDILEFIYNSCSDEEKLLIEVSDED